MPTVDWGLSRGVIDDYDRESGYKPYTGKPVPNGVYQWQIIKLVSVAGTNQKNPQLRATLKLTPRDKSEKRYGGYTITKFMVIADTTNFQFVPFLDAIGVTEADFRRRTVPDASGNVKKIGPWKNDGKTFVLAQLQDNRGEQADKYPKEIGWIGALEEEPEDEEEYEDDEESDEEYEEEEEAF